VGFKKEVAVLGDVDLVHAFAGVGLIRLDQPGRDRIPSDGLFGGRVEDLRRIAAKNHGPAGSVGELMEKRAAELRSLFAVQLHGGETNLFDGVTNLVRGMVDENADLGQALRQLGDDGVRGFRRDVARAPLTEDEP